MTTKASEAREIWDHAKVYGLGSIINRAAGLVLIPLYAHFLSPVEFGVYSIVVIAVEFAGILLSNALGTGMARVYLDTEDPVVRAATASTTFIFFIAGAAALLVLSYPLTNIAGQVLFFSDEWNSVILLALFSLLFNLLLELELNYYRLKKQPWIFLVLSAAKMVLMVSITFYFLYTLELGLFGVVLAATCAFALVSIPALIVVFSEVGISFDRTVVRNITVLTLPLIPARISDISTQFFDRYLIGIFVGVGVVGYYALAQRVASLLQLLVISPFAQIWIVRRLESLGEDVSQDVFRNIFRMFMAALISAALMISLYAQELIILIADDSFNQAATLVPALCLAAVLMPIDMNLQLGILHASRTGYMMWSSVISALVSLPLMLAFIAEWGAMGAAASVVLTNLIRITLTGYFGWRYCDSRIAVDLPVNTALILGGCIAYASAGYLVPLIVSDGNLLGAGALKLLIWLCYSLAAASMVVTQEMRRGLLSRFLKNSRAV